MTWVVLGMHKSGTSLVSEILHRAGIPMVETASDADYAAGNKWERASTLALDKAILDANDVDSLSLAPRDDAALLRDDHLERARRIAASLDAAGEWGFKDPRACLAWPLWRRVLRAPRIVGVYRDFGGVVGHFLENAAAVHRVGRHWRLRVEGLALRRWCEYNARVLEAIAGSDGSSILLSYERLMEGDEELDHLRRFVGRALADPRKPGKRRVRASGGLRARVGARVAQLAGAGSAIAIQARLESTRTALLERAAAREREPRR